MQTVTSHSLLLAGAAIVALMVGAVAIGTEAAGFYIAIVVSVAIVAAGALAPGGRFGGR